MKGRPGAEQRGLQGTEPTARGVHCAGPVRAHPVLPDGRSLPNGRSLPMAVPSRWPVASCPQAGAGSANCRCRALMSSWLNCRVRAPPLPPRHPARAPLASGAVYFGMKSQRWEVPGMAGDWRGSGWWGARAGGAMGSPPSCRCLGRPSLCWGGGLIAHICSPSPPGPGAGAGLP